MWKHVTVYKPRLSVLPLSDFHRCTRRPHGDPCINFTQRSGSSETRPGWRRAKNLIMFSVSCSCDPYPPSPTEVMGRWAGGHTGELSSQREETGLSQSFRLLMITHVCTERNTSVCICMHEKRKKQTFKRWEEKINRAWSITDQNHQVNPGVN